MNSFFFKIFSQISFCDFILLYFISYTFLSKALLAISILILPYKFANIIIIIIIIITYYCYYYYYYYYSIFIAIISTHLHCQKYPWVEFLRTKTPYPNSQRERKFTHFTSYSSRPVTANKCAKCAASAKLLFSLSNLLLFWRSAILAVVVIGP